VGTQEKNHEEEYYKVPIVIYRPGDKVENDLYFYHLRNYVLFKSKQTVWAQADTDKLINTQVDTLYIKFRSAKDHHAFLQAKLKTILSARDVPIERKASMLYETADPILSTVFTSPQSAELLAGASNYAKSCIQYLNERGSLPELVKLSSNSLTEHSHALHVSAYSIALAKRLGFNDQQSLFALGMGALLHDIGKSQISADILNKTGELNDDEWLLQTKPVGGFHPQLRKVFRRELRPGSSK
jgi:HD-GYP domain-containing protein (c-di-GMP phosphodiesterase class II)